MPCASSGDPREDHVQLGLEPPAGRMLAEVARVTCCGAGPCEMARGSGDPHKLCLFLILSKPLTFLMKSLLPHSLIELQGDGKISVIMS